MRCDVYCTQVICHKSPYAPAFQPDPTQPNPPSSPPPPRPLQYRPLITLPIPLLPPADPQLPQPNHPALHIPASRRLAPYRRVHHLDAPSHLPPAPPPPPALLDLVAPRARHEQVPHVLPEGAGGAEDEEGEEHGGRGRGEEGKVAAGAVGAEVRVVGDVGAGVCGRGAELEVDDDDLEEAVFPAAYQLTAYRLGGRRGGRSLGRLGEKRTSRRQRRR